MAATLAGGDWNWPICSAEEKALAMQLTKQQDALARLKGFRPGVTVGEDFIYLCARFCDSLSGTVAYEALRRRAEEFAVMTGPGSPLEDTRIELSILSGGEDQCQLDPRELSPWQAIRAALSFDDFRRTYGETFLAPDVGAPNGQRPLLPAKARNQQVFLRWWCVGEQTIHDSNWVTFNLFAAFAVAQCTVESQWQFHPPEFTDAVVRFRDQLWAVWRRADRDGLFGCYLLAKCYDAVNKGPAECGSLLKNLCELDVQARSAVDAAEQLCHLLADSDSTATGSAVASDSVAAATEPVVPAPNHDAAVQTGRTARQVTISMGLESYVLQCEGLEPFFFTPKENRLFTVFVHRAANGAATELVRWRAVNEIIDKGGPEADEKQDESLSKGFSLLNKRLREWAAPPDERDWIGVVRGKDGGRFLNASVKWLVDADQPTIRELKRRSQSISGPLVSQQKAAQYTPSRDSKLPARPRRDAPRREDEKEQG